MHIGLMLAALLPACSHGALNCRARTQSQPNPIAAQYPTLTTGTINGTIAVLPIEYSLARSIVPSQYAILEDAYRELLPSFPKGMYPAIIQTEFDHDIMTHDLSLVADFSRAGIIFPFVDRLNDGYTSMTYIKSIALTASNLVAIGGSAMYGEEPLPGVFNPPCQGYGHVKGSTTGETYFRVHKPSGRLLLNSIFAPMTGDEESPYSIAFWKNATNQPNFSSKMPFCDNYIRLFNSSVTKGQYAPTAVRGVVKVAAPLFATSRTFTGVHGLRLDNAFIENNDVFEEGDGQSAKPIS